MICRFLPKPWSDLSQILKIIYQHIFCSQKKFQNNLCMYARRGSTKHDCACTDIAWAQSLTLNHSCGHGHERIVWKISLENKRYVGSLSLKFEKDLLRGCGEICLSLALHVYLQFFFVFSAIFQVQGAKHTNCWKIRQSIVHFWKPIIKMSQFKWKNDTFSGQYSYF